MKPVGQIIQKISSIPHATLPPVERPQDPPERLFDPEDGTSTESLLIDVSDDFQYPDWAEGEVFRNLDDRVSGKEGWGPGGVGIDALAWYVSFHHMGGMWGIFIPVTSLVYFERKVFHRLAVSRAEKWQLGMHVLLEHERMHFAMDYTVAQWEILLNAPCWARTAAELRASTSRYLESEEMLANAYMLRRCKSLVRSNAQSAIRFFVKTQPPGYRDGITAIQDAAFRDSYIETLRTYISIHALERGLNWSEDAFDYYRQFPDSDELLGQCPIYLIHDERRLGLPPNAVRLITRIPSEQLRQTKSFEDDLRGLDSSLRVRWEDMKRKLSQGIPRSAGFEKMKAMGEEIFSVRLNKNFRVHLRFKDGIWEAFAVGSHKVMQGR